MDAMKKERLIELAESGLPPTAEEQRLLEADPAARTELDRLTVLFADVRRLPEPEIDEKELAGLLPAVRRGIESRRSRPPLAWLALRPAAARALAIAATLLLALNLLMPVAPEENPQGQVSQLDLVSSLALGIEPANSDLMTEAITYEDLDLFPDIEEMADSGSEELFFDDSTLALMNVAVGLDKEQFSQLEKLLGFE